MKIVIVIIIVKLHLLLLFSLSQCANQFKCIDSFNSTNNPVKKILIA